MVVSSVSESQFSSVRVPTMIVRGEKDTGLGEAADKFLTKIPTATSVQV